MERARAPRARAYSGPARAYLSTKCNQHDLDILVSRRRYPQVSLGASVRRPVLWLGVSPASGRACTTAPSDEIELTDADDSHAHELRFILAAVHPSGRPKCGDEVRS
jgi:hypothetical protein